MVLLGQKKKKQYCSCDFFFLTNYYRRQIQLIVTHILKQIAVQKHIKCKNKYLTNNFVFYLSNEIIHTNWNMLQLAEYMHRNDQTNKNWKEGYFSEYMTI